MLFIVAFDFVVLFFAVAIGFNIKNYPLSKKEVCISDLSH